MWEDAVENCFEEFYARAVIKYLATEQECDPVEIIFYNANVDADIDFANYRIFYPSAMAMCNDNSHERRIAIEQICKACGLSSSILNYYIVCRSQNGNERKRFSGKIIGASLNSFCVEVNRA